MAPVPILKQSDILIASVQSALSDLEWLEFQQDLTRRVGAFRIKAVVIDVTLMDVMDSFATRVIRSITEIVSLRGAKSVLVGIQPEVALAMVQMGLAQRLRGIETALDLEQGLSVISGAN